VKEISEVSEDSSNRAADPTTELWRRWFETSARAWSEMFGGARENYPDPYRLYRQWFSGLEEARKQGARPAQALPFAEMMNPTAAMWGSAASQAEAPATPAGVAEAHSLWKEWFEALAESWRETAELEREAVELTPRWMEMLSQVWYNFLSAEGLPTDPLHLFTRWYNATDGPLSEFVGDLIQREEILELSSRFLRSYASFYSRFRRDSERYLKALQLPVNSDITRVAGLVVGIEDKLDRLEEAFEEFEYGYARPATAESLEDNRERIERLEQTLERIEEGTTDATTADSESGLENRIDGVEAKIDRLLAALENAPQENGVHPEVPQEEEAPLADGPPEIRATAAARREAQERGVNLAEVQGTGANGQITVDDVRREGVS